MAIDESYTATIGDSVATIRGYTYKIGIDCYDYALFKRLVEYIKAFEED